MQVHSQPLATLQETNSLFQMALIRKMLVHYTDEIFIHTPHLF